MTDLIVIAGLVAAFAALAGLVSLCDRIIGPDPSDLDRDRDLHEDLDRAQAEREGRRADQTSGPAELVQRSIR